MGVLPPGGVNIEPYDLDPREFNRQLTLNLLCADTEILDNSAFALRAHVWRPHRVVAVVAPQRLSRGVIGQCYVAVLAPHHVPAVLAQNDGRMPAAVQEQDDLPTSVNVKRDSLSQRFAEYRLAAVVMLLLSHIDYANRGHLKPHTGGETVSVYNACLAL